MGGGKDFGEDVGGEGEADEIGGKKSNHSKEDQMRLTD